jgi:hypothetical protein
MQHCIRHLNDSDSKICPPVRGTLLYKQIIRFVSSSICKNWTSCPAPPAPGLPLRALAQAQYNLKMPGFICLTQFKFWPIHTVLFRWVGHLYCKAEQSLDQTINFSNCFRLSTGTYLPMFRNWIRILATSGIRSLIWIGFNDESSKIANRTI